jgi:type IV pilus assembly protein PilV
MLKRPTRRGSAGIGLLDALIALALLSFGMLAMTRFQGRLVAQSTESQSRQVASQLSAELISTVLVDARNAACYTLPQTGSCSNAAAKTRTAEWATRVASSLPGTVSTAAALDTSNGRMTLSIQWTGKATGDTRTLQAATDVRTDAP